MRLNRSSGMTLMELVVVMGLVAVLLVALIPRFVRSDRITDADQAVRMLSGLVSRLKEDAMRDGNVYILHVDMDRRRFWAASEPPTSPEVPSPSVEPTERKPVSKSDRDSVVWQLPDDVTGMAVRFPPASPIDSGVVQIRFYPQGYSYAAAIRVDGRDGASHCLQIEPFLGEPILLADQGACGG